MTQAASFPCYTVVELALDRVLHALAGVVQIKVTPKTRSPFTLKALSIPGVTWKWHFLNHADG